MKPDEQLAADLTKVLLYRAERAAWERIVGVQAPTIYGFLATSGPWEFAVSFEADGCRVKALLDDEITINITETTAQIISKMAVLAAG